MPARAERGALQRVAPLCGVGVAPLVNTPQFVHFATKIFSKCERPSISTILGGAVFARKEDLPDRSAGVLLESNQQKGLPPQCRKSPGGRQTVTPTVRTMKIPQIARLPHGIVSSATCSIRALKDGYHPALVLSTDPPLKLVTRCGNYLKKVPCPESKWKLWRTAVNFARAFYRLTYVDMCAVFERWNSGFRRHWPTITIRDFLRRAINFVRNIPTCRILTGHRFSRPTTITYPDHRRKEIQDSIQLPQHTHTTSSRTPILNRPCPGLQQKPDCTKNSSGSPFLSGESLVVERICASPSANGQTSLERPRATSAFDIGTAKKVIAVGNRSIRGRGSTLLTFLRNWYSGCKKAFVDCLTFS